MQELLEHTKQGAGANCFLPNVPENNISQNNKQIGKIHPRIKEMARAMQDIAAAMGFVDKDQLKLAGFSESEIAKFSEPATILTNIHATKRYNYANIDFADFVKKAKLAKFDDMPLPENVLASDDIKAAWERYSNACQAFKLYSWKVLRDLVVAEFLGFLNTLPISSRDHLNIFRHIQLHIKNLPTIHTGNFAKNGDFAKNGGAV